MSLHVSAAFQGASPTAWSPPLYLTQTHDDLTQSVYSSATIRDPQAQLLQRWTRLSELISRVRLSANAVITLNRSLDLAEEAVHKSAMMDDGWKRGEKAEGSEIYRLVDPGVRAGTLGEAAALLPSAPVYRAERTSRQEPQVHEYLLKRVTKAVDLLRYGQQDFKRLHEMMLVRIEKQANKMRRLKLHATCLEQDVVDDESELTYLKLQLRIIEVQTLPYWPRKDQDELAAAIERWKRDWADVDGRYRERRWKRQAGNALHLKSGSSAEIGAATSNSIG